MRPILLLVPLVLAGGCATPTPIPTASGKPEVVLPAVKKDAIGVVLAHLMAQGFAAPESVNDYQAVVPDKGFLGVRTRWQLLFLETGATTKVIATGESNVSGDRWEASAVRIGSPGWRATEMIAALDGAKAELAAKPKQ